jgi:hypothetical protein
MDNILGFNPQAPTTKEFIEALRLHFRERFKQSDYDIGEQEIEKVFRELLGEPEPKDETLSTARTPGKDISMIVWAEINRMTPMLKELFEANDALFKRMK